MSCQLRRPLSIESRATRTCTAPSRNASRSGCPEQKAIVTSSGVSSGTVGSIPTRSHSSLIRSSKESRRPARSSRSSALLIADSCNCRLMSVPAGARGRGVWAASCPSPASRSLAVAIPGVVSSATGVGSSPRRTSGAQTFSRMRAAISANCGSALASTSRQARLMILSITSRLASGSFSSC